MLIFFVAVLECSIRQHHWPDDEVPKDAHGHHPDPARQRDQVAATQRLCHHFRGPKRNDANQQDNDPFKAGHQWLILAKHCL